MKTADLIQAYADGKMTRAEIVKALVAQKYSAPAKRTPADPPNNEWDDEWIVPRDHTGTFGEVVQARNQGLIDGELLLEIARAREAKYLKR